MKSPLRFVVPFVLAMAAASISLSPLAAQADGHGASDIKLLRTYPKMSAEESKQLLFSARIYTNPEVVSFNIHNPFRDRVIAALVMEVSYKRPGEEKPVEYEILAHISCGPLQSMGGQENCFNANEAAKFNPTISLKEVYLEPQPPAETK